MSSKAGTLERPPATVAAADTSLALGRAVLWGLLGAKVVSSWGVQWDIQWHVVIGRDSFWIPPHLMIYAGVTLIALLSFGVLAWTTLRPSSVRGATVRVLGLTGTRGFHLAAWGIAITLLAAPIDDLWHRLFGIDVSLWSPPHLLGLLGAAVNTLGCFVIAREVYPARSRAGFAALVLTGTLLLVGLHFALQPTFRFAYLYGSVFFHGYAMLAPLLVPLALVATARLTGSRWVPVLVLLCVIVLGLAGRQIARAGFQILQPVSVIQEEIAKDPTSPIAVANAIARENGTEPGTTAGPAQLLGLVPVAAMVFVDPRRRPIAATVAYALVLFGVMGVRLAGLPAFRPLVPAAAETLGALFVTGAAGLAGGWIAGRVAALLDPEPAPRG
ncbi:MAG: hypothetical protein HYU25_07560 [Candidatus Rokubacteria bacterium]|nr:hypothetical protein [Candidatus Rokubacteria bacterium]